MHHSSLGLLLLSFFWLHLIFKRLYHDTALGSVAILSEAWGRDKSLNIFISSGICLLRGPHTGRALLPNLHYPSLTDEFRADVGKGSAIMPKLNAFYKLTQPIFSFSASHQLPLMFVFVCRLAGQAQTVSVMCCMYMKGIFSQSGSCGGSRRFLRIRLIVGVLYLQCLCRAL